MVTNLPVELPPATLIFIAPPETCPWCEAEQIEIEGTRGYLWYSCESYFTKEVAAQSYRCCAKAHAKALAAMVPTAPWVSEKVALAAIKDAHACAFDEGLCHTDEDPEEHTPDETVRIFLDRHSASPAPEPQVAEAVMPELSPHHDAAVVTVKA